MTPEEVQHGADAAPEQHEAQPPMGAADQPTLEPASVQLRLLARLADRGAVPRGTEELKAAVQSAWRTLPAEGADPWGWLVEGARRVGLRVSLLEQPWGEARALLETGPLLARGPGGWLLLLGDEATGVRVYRPERDEEQLLPAEAVEQELGLASAQAPTRWAVTQEQVPATAGAAVSEPSPAWRLVRLVAPDRRDIKTLVVFSAVVGVLNLATPVAVEALVNTVAFVGLLQPIIILSLVLALCLGLAAAVRALEAVVVELIQRRVFVRVATELAYRLPRVRRDALDAVHGPELVNRFFDVTTVQKVGAKLLLDGVTAVLSAGIGLLVLAFYHPLLLAFDAMLLGALAVIVFVMGRGALKTAIKESSAKYALADWLEELVRHPLAFHLAGGREIALDHADTLANSYLERRRGHYRVVFRQLLGALALQVLASTLLLGLGGWLVKVGELTLGQLVASWLIVSLVLAAVAKLGRQLEGVYDLLAAAQKLGMLLDLPLEGEQGEELPARQGPVRVELRDVGYDWVGGTPCLRGLDLDVPAGEAVAICGPSGVGKSTLLELIQGQRQARGRIAIDGVELRSLRLSSLRPQVGLARSGEVMSGTVAENVRLGRQLDLEQVRGALEAVGLWEAVQALPEGVGTRLVSFGRPLSEGQADLLALARVIASRPRLLLVDGLLDGLDEEALDRVLRALTQDAPWTLIVATRRTDIARRLGRRLRLTPRGLEELK